jgi:putative NIF3 family GTP cyclohydrolase 1 type 2
MNKLSRRQFAQIIGAGAAAGNLAFAQKGKITAGEVVERIKQHVGIPWIADGHRDSFKIGGPDSPVMGICTTHMADLRVLQQAQKAGLNFVINHETTFYDDADRVELVKDDPLYKLKRNFAESNNMVVWRIHDNWHAMKPDGIFVGWNRALGFDKYQVGEDQRMYDVPETTLDAVARHIAKALGSRSVRAIGDPSLKIRKIGRGAHSLGGNMEILPKVDMILISEAREFDSIEYIRDSIMQGQKKGMVLVSHEAGEEAGMEYFAEWLGGFVKEVPIKFISCTDDFWMA